MPRHGATLGKYAPLHRGHQLVIETALGECDQVTVVVYDAPSTTTVPLTVRSGWVRALYPQVTVLEGWAGPEEVGDDAQRTQDDYLRRLGLTDVTHFYSSEAYGAATATALGAELRKGRALDVAQVADGDHHRFIGDEVLGLFGIASSHDDDPCRAVLATLTSLFIGLLFGPAVIRRLTAMKIGQAVRTDGSKHTVRLTVYERRRPGGGAHMGFHDGPHAA